MMTEEEMALNVAMKYGSNSEQSQTFYKTLKQYNQSKKEFINTVYEIIMRIGGN